MKVLEIKGLMGRGGQISTIKIQDSGWAVSCKKSHNQKGYIGKNQNTLKCLIYKACREYCSRFEKMKNILKSHNKPP